MHQLWHSCLLIGKSSQIWIRVIQSLVACNGQQYHSMLPWLPVLSFKVAQFAPYFHPPMVGHPLTDWCYLPWLKGSELFGFACKSSREAFSGKRRGEVPFPEFVIDEYDVINGISKPTIHFFETCLAILLQLCFHDLEGAVKDRQLGKCEYTYTVQLCSFL